MPNDTREERIEGAMSLNCSAYGYPISLLFGWAFTAVEIMLESAYATTTAITSLTKKEAISKKTMPYETVIDFTFKNTSLRPIPLKVS